MYNEWVKKARKIAGLKQNKLAELIKCNVVKVSAWENGLYKPLLMDILDVSIATKVPVLDELRDKMIEAVRICQSNKEENVNLHTSEFSNDLSKFLKLNIEKLDTRFVEFFLQNDNSMEPTLHLNDLLIVDTKKHAFESNAFYVIDREENYIVRRIILRDGKNFELLSDNTNFKENTLITNDIDIKGKVLAYLSFTSLYK